VGFIPPLCTSACLVGTSLGRRIFFWNSSATV